MGESIVTKEVYINPLKEAARQAREALAVRKERHGY